MLIICNLLHVLLCFAFLNFYFTFNLSKKHGKDVEAEQFLNWSLIIWIWFCQEKFLWIFLLEKNLHLMCEKYTQINEDFF